MPELASAFYELDNQIPYELIPLLEGKNTLTFDFELRRIKETRSGLIIDNNLDGIDEIWLDYLPNSFSWPIMSEELKSTVEFNLQGEEQIDWITCKIKKEDELRTYYILRFNKRLDVLDLKKTKFAQDTDVIIKPFFSMIKIARYSIFMATTNGYGNLWKITSSLYINEKLKKAIQKKKLTGLDFEKVSVE